MIVIIEAILYWMHALIVMWVIFLPVTNFIALGHPALKIFNIAFFLVVSIAQAITWPRCIVTIIQNQLREKMNPPKPALDSFVADFFNRMGMNLDMEKVKTAQLIIFPISVASFLLWLL